MLTLALALLLAPPPGLPDYTHPRDPSAREQAAARAWEVWHAIREATQSAELRAELWRICRRESACNWQGVVTWHEGDAAGGRSRWRAAVRTGKLHPERCEHHQLGDAARWTSYGAFGIAAAWTVRHVDECVGPEVLDDPRVAARAAVKWIESLCRMGACTCEARTKWWIGPGVWAKRSRWSRLSAIDRQCANVAWWRWPGALALDGLAMLTVRLPRALADAVA